MTGIMDDPCPIEVGTEGTVTEVREIPGSWSQIDVKWDNGRSLMLLPGDPFAVVGRGPAAEKS